MEYGPIKAHDDQGRLDLCLARNDFIDAFSDLEAAVCRVLNACGHELSNKPFGQRLSQFREAKETSLIAKANFASRDKLADEIAEMLPIRADIVHSRMRPCVIDGEVAAWFVNSQQAHGRLPSGRLITLRQLQALVAELQFLKESIKSLNKVSKQTDPAPDTHHPA